MNIKNIEKAVKQEDSLILLYAPTILNKYGRNIRIEQVNWYYKWDKFCYYIGIFLGYYYNICGNVTLPDNLHDFEKFRKTIQISIGASKPAFWSLVRVCKFAKVNKIFQTRWMLKNFTLDDWAEVFIYLYIYNVKGVKKNLKVGLSAITKAQLN